MRIALINNLYPPYIVGGNEILARDVTESLRARGHEVHILTGRGANLPADGYTHGALDIDLDRKADYFLGGLPLTAKRVVDWHLYNHRTYTQVQETLRRVRPDLIICWNLGMASAAPLLAARTTGAPVIAHPADKWLLSSLNNIGALVPANTAAQRVFVESLHHGVQPALRAYGAPDYILCVSEFIRTLHIDAGYPEAQSAATWLGIDTTRFGYWQHSHPGLERPWRLVYAGQLWAGKGPQVAVEAVRLHNQRSDLPKVTLDIYGGGADGFLQWLQGQIVEKGVQESVALRGFASTQALIQAFHSSDLYLFCSIWDEPFSGGLLEALATGLPTIATTAGGTPEAIVSGENGLLVPPDNPAELAAAIERMMRDPEGYTRIGIRAAVDVRQRWEFTHYIDRLESHYSAIVQGHRPGAPVRLGG